MSGIRGPDEGVDDAEEQARNYLYDLSALITVFHGRGYGAGAVKESIDQYAASVDARYGHLEPEVAIMTRLPRMRTNVNLREVIAGLKDDFDIIYAERQPYIIACVMYFSVMQGARWDLVRFLQVIEQNVRFNEGIDRGKNDGEMIRARVESGTNKMPFDMYKAAYRKLHEELEVVRGILGRCKGQIRILDALLAQEEAGLSGPEGYVH